MVADGGGADIPDDDELQGSICGPGYHFDSSSRLLLEPKDKIRERLGFSPDAGDALALTFAEPVRTAMANYVPPQRTNNIYDPHRWMQGRG